MIRKFEDSDRRILTFPAVHLCDGVAPETLLSSLINISQSINGYRSKFFSCNKRNGYEAIRQVRTLQMFLEEIRDSNSDVPDSVILSLSELHSNFQKVQYLLEDCTREGARLLMLMVSEHVANHFRVLFRSIATALDVLPLASIDVPIEAKEHVELLMKQGRRAMYGVDGCDEKMVNEVTRILGQFEDGFTPKRGRFKRVLDYIGIEKWSSCNKEVKFLNSEIELECSSQEKSDADFTLLSNLMAFMSYCRCALFESIDCEAVVQIDQGIKDVFNGLNPDEFRCPISFDYMNDPVTVETGHTYDRSSIQKWFGGGNSICPSTGEKLKNKTLVPNMALRRLIQNYFSEKSSQSKRDITKTITPGSRTAEKIIRALARVIAELLESGEGTEQNRAAYEIKLLTKASIFNRSCFVQTDIICNLINLLRSSDIQSQENAIAALSNLSKHSKSRKIIAENDGLQEIICVLKKGFRTEARQLAADVVFYMASIEECRNVIGENPDAISGLINLLKDGTDRGKKNSLVALYGLIMHLENHRKVISSGAIPLLINVLKSDDENLVTDSLAILTTLAEKSEGAEEILRYRPLNSIVGFLDSSNSNVGKEYCVSLLVALAVNGDGLEVIPILARSHSLMTSLYNVLREGTSYARKKASYLIRILQEYSEKYELDLIFN